ncbi:MAG: hypothetical protein E6J90_15150 [Deltaproteobacteria bacterium]|nr:MAG: hypothetical protein E6J90_15150 [Deltaproteobacteria bacterium]
MSAGNVARVVAVLAACVAAVGSATSSSNQNQSVAGPGSQASPPPPQQMDAQRALGLWRSTFGAVKIEPDDSKGGLDAGSVQGIWVYQRQGQEVVGYFAGNLRGNVLQFRWQEPNDPPLTGEGFLVFDVQGQQYSGRWWSDKRDRIGDWNGWRQAVSGARPPEAAPDGQGGTDQRVPQRRQPYQPYRPQPYQPQSQQQPPPPSQAQPPAEPRYF